MSKIIFGVAKSCVTCANINYVKKGLKIHRVVGCDLHNEELGDEYIYKVCPDWEKGSSVIYEKLPVLENDHNLTEEGELLNLFKRSIPKITWVEGKGTRYPVVGEKKKIKFQLSAKKIGDLDELGETLTEKMKNFYGSVFEITRNGFKSIIYDSEVGGRFYLIGYKDNGNIIFEIDPTIDTSPISIQNLYNYLKENYDSNIVVLEQEEV